MFTHENLFIIPEGVETRWASMENQKSEKGGGDKAMHGRKGCPQFAFPKGASRVLAEEKSGKGSFLGCNIGVVADTEAYLNSWWGEGEVKMYIDGDSEWPTLCGTGTEDFIGTAWGQGRYANLHQGCHIADFEKMEFCFYRYHVVDPIYFHSDICVTIQQLGCWNPDLKPLFAYHGAQLQDNSGRMVDFYKDRDHLHTHGLFERQDDWSCCAYLYLDRAEG